MEKRIDARAVLAAIAAVALAVTLLYSARTSGAQFTASTNNSSNEFWAGQIDVTTDLVQPILLNSDSLYPGLEIQECMQVAYVGTIEGVSTRMYANAVSGGLADYLQIVIEKVDGVDSCDDPNQGVATIIFDGSLTEFAAVHGDYNSGYDLGLSEPGAQTVLRVSAEVVDDNDAQGLSADFSFFLEGRP